MSLSKSGWLTKQGGMIKSWKRRWFTINGSTIHYYSKQNDLHSEKGSFDLSMATVVAAATPKECRKQPSFKVVIPNKRTYYIKADTEAERNSWIQTLQQVMQDAKSGGNMPHSAPAPNTQPNLMVTTAGGNTSNLTAGYQNNNGMNPNTSNIARNNSTSNVQIKPEDFDYIRVLGRGTYGKVQLVRYKKDGQIYAMKSMSKQILHEHEQIEQSLTERDILLKTRHPFLVSAHYTFQTPEKLFMVLDYVPGGELFNRLKVETKFNEQRAKLYAAEIMLGLGKLHSLGLIFRDLKPENILVGADGHLRITDFGLVKTNMSSTTTTNTFCGTPEYMAPEMIQQLPYTKAVDWWSFGVLLFEMLTGLPPFYDSNTSKMYRMILHDELTFPPYVSPDARDLIAKLLNRNPAIRLGASERDVEEIKIHPFFGEYNWDDILAKKVEPLWKPQIQSVTDTSNFDHEFTGEAAGNSYLDQPVLSPDVQANFENFTCTEPDVL
ncbi:RAC family serine/threonine-protein kinase like protein [Tritrichomonas foetus]|uniref:non-specific serine/threonine protein kinase n=1 Tax=Tritrichomonas foetus TaxID=1144522 RepID=A0A1J4JR05_9EUKA|nr:RAC family serine/threonine-protein kinase like protein [Tritrichomonas foetus]|eukprot:OHT01178.1 RAC family serine/threonine-protein kinase like protein [Tritrichomonas foetus]